MEMWGTPEKGLGRGDQVAYRVTKEERSLLDIERKRRGLTYSQLIRLAIKDYISGGQNGKSKKALQGKKS